MPTARAKKETATTTKKVATKMDTPEKVVEEKPIKKENVKKKKVFTDSDYILCRSVCYGGLNVTSQSGNLYEFKDYGYDCEINYRDLVSLIRKGSDHVFLPRFVILDEDLLEDFPTVKRVYEKMYTRNDLLDILRMPVHQMEMEIRELPDTTRSVLEQMVATEIANGNLDSISKVRKLSEIFDSDFNLLSELFVK
nr:MAG TPA: hypothetical protein [Caudoviricetes sp.]